MDAKSKAEFINSVAKGENVPCPNCNTANEAGSKFCIACGTQLTTKVEEVAEVVEVVEKNEAVEEKKDVPAFGVIAEPEEAIVEAMPSVEESVDVIPVFAEGLPEWDIVPPQVMVRRR